MAFVGDVFLAGKDLYNGDYKCGIAYTLSEKSPISKKLEFEHQNWEVELLSGSIYVVARTKNKVDYNELQTLGFSLIQKALDVVSVTGYLSATLSSPAISSIGIYHKDNKLILFVYDLTHMPMSGEIEITRTDLNGNIIPKPVQADPIWNESFRYYRLSQCSNDQFEAYRNLFLAFEALLNSICPKSSSEGEAKWLERALTQVNQGGCLSEFNVSNKTNPVKYIIRSQYKDIRCKLQHAKFPNAQLPHSKLSPSSVKQAYVELTRIWRKIASVYLHVSNKSSMTFTYIGFKIMMDRFFDKEVTISFTSDDSLPEKDGSQVSPKGLSVYKFDSSNYLGEVELGIVRVLSNESVTQSTDKYKFPIYRICIGESDKPIGVSYIEEGLKVSGVDAWEHINDFYLVNSSHPKSEFNT